MLFRQFKMIIFVICFFVLLSCGKSADEKLKDSLLSAEIHLSKRECQSAITLLEGLGRQNSNARYLKDLSSSYACRAGYSTIVYFGSDIALSVTPAPMGGMTKYSTSLVTATAPLTDDDKFRDLQTAIDILLYAGGIGVSTEPSATERAKYFSSGKAGDINAQLAFMMLVQLGKFMKIYSNASAAGVKGGGGAGNNCFTNYTNITTPAVTTALGLLPGACTVANSSHAQLATAVVGRRARLCEGVVLLNGILDILPSIVASASGGDINSISTLTTNINTYRNNLTTAFPAIGTVMSVLNQSNCETDSAITLDTLESYYALIFESLIQ